MKNIFLAVIVIILIYAGPTQAAIVLEASDRSLWEFFSLVLGGIGIFLVGIHHAGSHLQKISGGTFKILITRMSENRMGVFIWGMLLGFITQSGKAAAFILSDFVQADMIKVRHCFPIVFWGNVGCSLIVFASMLSIQMLALIVLGITALGSTFSFPKRMVNTYNTLFGLAMIMYGLYLVKSGAAGFASYEQVHSWIEYLAGYPLFSFLTGLILTLLVQSNLAIMMIAIALGAAGLLTLEECAMVMYGAQAGTGLLTYVFSFHTKGRARQVVAAQIAFDGIATAAFVCLFYIEWLSDFPLIIAAARSVSTEVGTQAVALALIFQFCAALILVAIRTPVFDFIEKKFPPSEVEILSELAYLHKNASDSPETGLILARKEQVRLLERLPLYIDFVRDGSTASESKSPAAYHDAFLDISSIIGDTLSSISSHSLNTTDSDHLILATKLLEQLIMLEEIVFKLTKDMQRDNLEPKAMELGRNIMESLDFMILTAIDAIQTSDGSEIDTLAILTQDRTEMMSRIRHSYFNSEAEFSGADRNFILDVTILLENAVHTLARYGTLLKADAH
jgi:phosphate:Na+ symporter